VDRRKELLDVDGGGSEEVFAEVLGWGPGARGGVGERGSVDDFSDEGETVGVDSRGGDSEEDISGLDVRGGEHEVSLDSSDGESGEIVVV